jgi:hypothetical protein
MVKKKRHFAVCESGLKFSIRPFPFFQNRPTGVRRKRMFGPWADGE